MAGLTVAEKTHWKDRLAARFKAAVERIKARHPATFARLGRGVPIEEVSDNLSLRYGTELPLPVEVGAALEKRQAAHLDALLAADEVGREVRRLEAEQERLLDTVWLAASPSQIKQLWTKVGALLGDEPTALEAEALAIAPPEEG